MSKLLQNYFSKLDRVTTFDPGNTLIHLTVNPDDPSPPWADVTIFANDFIEMLLTEPAIGDMHKFIYDPDEDGKVLTAETADVALSVEWDDVENPPVSFPPEAHDHVLDDITDAGALAALDKIDNTYLTGRVTISQLPELGQNQLFIRSSSGTGNPQIATLGATLKLSAGVLNADLTGLGGGDMLGSNNLNDVDDPLTSFDNIKQVATDSYSGVVTLAVDKGTSAGTVVQATDARLSDTRDPNPHGHEIGDIDELEEALDDKAAAIHGHVIGDIDGLESELSDKSKVGHTHIISDVSGLQTELNNKADASHNHDATNITTGALALARGGLGTSLTAPDEDRIIFYDKSASKTAFLGLGSGLKFDGTTLETDGVQMVDAQLTSFLALEWTADGLPYMDTDESWAVTPITAQGRTMLAAEDAEGVATALNLGTAAFLDVGTGDSNVITGLDARLTDKRAPTSHSHSIGDLPVAPSGTSNTTQLVRADDSRLSNSRAPNGNAGGLLAGTYPNPTLQPHASIIRNFVAGGGTIWGHGWAVIETVGAPTYTNVGLPDCVRVTTTSSRSVMFSPFSVTQSPDLPLGYLSGIEFCVGIRKIVGQSPQGAIVGYMDYNPMYGMATPLAAFTFVNPGSGDMNVYGVVLADSTEHYTDPFFVGQPTTTPLQLRLKSNGGYFSFYVNGTLIGEIVESPDDPLYESRFGVCLYDMPQTDVLFPEYLARVNDRYFVTDYT